MVCRAIESIMYQKHCVGISGWLDCGRSDIDRCKWLLFFFIFLFFIFFAAAVVYIDINIIKMC